MSGKTVLVTGGHGFFGAWVVKHLLRDGSKAVIFDLNEDKGIFEQVTIIPSPDALKMILNTHSTG